MVKFSAIGLCKHWRNVWLCSKMLKFDRNSPPLAVHHME